MSDRISQLLSVWNPFYEPHTVQVHGEILRRNEKVWWGRLYRGPTDRFTAEAARDKWSEVATLADQAAGEGRELVMYVTNYEVLHALRISRVIFGSELPDEERPFVPPYYKKADIPVGMWFEVRDLRALAWNQLDTMRFCLETGRIGNEYGYDPYASFLHKYPLVLDGAPVEETFDPAHLRGRHNRFVDLPESLYPPAVDEASRELATRLDGVGERLEQKSQAFLASAWLIYHRLGHASGFDLSAALVGVSRAVETEVSEGIFGPLIQCGGSVWGDADLAHERILGTGDRARRLTLGMADRRLTPLIPVAEELGLQGLRYLARHREWRSWFSRFVSQRNGAAHVEQLPMQRVRRSLEDIFDGEATQLRPLVPAKLELERRLAAVESPALDAAALPFARS